MDAITVPDVYKNLLLADVYTDDFYERHGLWTNTTNSGSATALGSNIGISTAATTDNAYSYLSTTYGTLTANKTWEMTVRFSTNVASGGAMSTTNYIAGWILTASVGANALADNGAGVAAGAFCGIYSLDGGGGRWVLAAQGASETRQTKVLDWSLTDGASLYHTLKLRLQANGTTASLYVYNDNATGVYYPESASRYGVQNLAPVRGYQDPAQVPFAYLDNITLHAAAQSVILGTKCGTAHQATMTVDCIGLARTR